MGRYGIMPERDYETLDKTLDLVCKTFPNGIINTCEIGVHKGNGSRGIHDRISIVNKRINFHTGIDNQRDLPIEVPFPGCHLILGNSMEVYNQLRDFSQHFILIDGCHNYPMTMVDFLLYKDKVSPLGYIAFHDTGVQIPPFKDYQGMGSKDDPDMFIACRKAVKRLGLLDNKFPGWRIVFDEYDINHDTGGLLVVQKFNIDEFLLP